MSELYINCDVETKQELCKLFDSVKKQGAAEERERLWQEINNVKWDYVSKKGWVMFVRDLTRIFGKDGADDGRK